MTGKMLGLAVGRGYCTCRACNRPYVRRDRRRQRQREKRQWAHDEAEALADLMAGRCEHKDPTP